MRPTHLLLALTLATTQGASFASAQWDIEESHTTASLRGIHNVGGGVAWASGTDGTVLRTEDGGYLWQTCAIPPGAEKLDFRGIQAFDENTAIVMSSGPGDQSRLYKTTDGCQTWKLVFTNPDKDGFWDALQFAKVSSNANDKCFGVLLGDPVDKHFPMFLTYDCGERWERQIQQSPEIEPHGEAAFAASNSSLVINGLMERIFVTGGKGGPRILGFWVGLDDTGLSDPIKVMKGAKPVHFLSKGWSTSALPAKNPSDSSGAFSFAQRDWHEVIVGGNYKLPEQTGATAWFIDRSHPTYTTNWTHAQTPPHGYRSSVDWDSNQKLWITVGPNGTDISTDDGKNWRPLTPSSTDPADADKNWNALSLPFVVGPHGRIGRLRTIDQKAIVTKKP
jgi:photosystem II stability/assembly factor-like uncharacterized protein